MKAEASISRLPEFQLSSEVPLRIFAVAVETSPLRVRREKALVDCQ
jgi:hypothetical protein